MTNSWLWCYLFYKNNLEVKLWQTHNFDVICYMWIILKLNGDKHITLMLFVYENNFEVKWWQTHNFDFIFYIKLILKLNGDKHITLMLFVI